MDNLSWQQKTILQTESLAKQLTFSYSMPYIFWRLWLLAIIWAIRKAFQCILQGVRFLPANHTRLSPTSENESYPLFTEILAKPIILNTFQGSPKNRKRSWAERIFISNTGYAILSWINSSHHLRGRGGKPKDDMMTMGRSGVSIPPKSDDIIYEQPLTKIQYHFVNVNVLIW